MMIVMIQNVFFSFLVHIIFLNISNTYHFSKQKYSKSQWKYLPISRKWHPHISHCFNDFWTSLFNLFQQELVFIPFSRFMIFVCFADTLSALYKLTPFEFSSYIMRFPIYVFCCALSDCQNHLLQFYFSHHIGVVAFWFEIADLLHQHISSHMFCTL